MKFILSYHLILTVTSKVECDYILLQGIYAFVQNKKGDPNL
jgi:hypothetical protein